MSQDRSPESPTDDVERCLNEIADFLERCKFDGEVDGIEQPFAAALLARAVLMTRTAATLVGGPNEGGIGVLLRVAVECWVDCCYVMYCRLTAALDLFADSLSRREKLRRLWLPGIEVPHLAQARLTIDGVLRQAIDAGVVPPNYTPNASLDLETRLKRAIDAKEASSDYLNVYGFLYRGLSTSEVHTAVGMDAHLSVDDDENLRVQIAPSAVFPPHNLVRVMTLLCVGAARDLYTQRSADTAALESYVQEVGNRLAAEHARADQYLEGFDEEVRELLNRWLKASDDGEPGAPSEVKD